MIETELKSPEMRTCLRVLPCKELLLYSYSNYVSEHTNKFHEQILIDIYRKWFKISHWFLELLLL
jgi:hypothetical protein